MAKRKRDVRDEGSRPGDLPAKKPGTKGLQHAKQAASVAGTGSETIQIITGSYDRVLHGFTATFDLSKVNLDDSDVQPEVSFADTFMFNAHSSAIRCLALSPLTAEAEGVPSKLILASGGSDERINLYNLSANAPSPSDEKVAIVPSLSSVARQENSKNREIGALIHHSSTITQLCFAGKSKLLSSSEDNTIAVSRARDWTVLSTFKPPMPKIQGRPSGDTAPPGGAPAGVNDFAIHPSKKLTLSVGKGERTMRLWNLVVGKMGGVQDFERDLLRAVGETKHSTGEAQSILFSPDETNFVVSFDRGAAVFRLPFEMQGLVLPTPSTKLHKMRFLPGTKSNLLAVSTDNGRVLFFDTESFDGTVENTEYKKCKLVAQLGGPSEGVAIRIKSFEVIQLSGNEQALAVVTACSDGSIRLWYLDAAALSGAESKTGKATKSPKEGLKETNGVAIKSATTVAQVGKLLGRYDTANRITCMEAFKMLSPVELSGSGDKRNDNGAVSRGQKDQKSRSSKSQAEIDHDEEDEEDEEFAGFD